MIEPTDEMQSTAVARAREWAVQHRHDLPDDRMIWAVLPAVLALVERDYGIEVHKLRAAFDRAGKSRDLWKQRAMDAGWVPGS